MTHEPKTSNGDQEPAMAIIIGVERRVTLEWIESRTEWVDIDGVETECVESKQT
jgi:hypothetical protein